MTPAGPRGPIALCYGTRPQVIKASVLRRTLAGVAPVLAVDTGQHYDYALNALLYEQLGVARPDLCLEVGSATHAEQTAAMLTRVEPVFRERQPCVVVVIGDTNSTVACALAAGKLRIPVVHVEAGLRAADTLMAEEINRRVVDAFAQLLCTPSATATARMRAEHPDALVAETGDVARDVLLAQLARLPDVGALIPDRARDGFAFATLHRAELTDDPALLRGVLAALAALPVPVVLALHPRTRAAMDGHGIAGPAALSIIPAVGYLESLAMTRRARVVITDSGGMQREAYWLGTPCVTVRTETEWTETLALGANRLVRPDSPGALARAVEEQGAAGGWDRDAYGRGDAAACIADQVASLIGIAPVPR